MAEYIKRDFVMKKIMATKWMDGHDGAMAMAIAASATAADVAPVVRCKDCAVPHNKYTGCPELKGLVTPPDFYCPFGERKDGDDSWISKSKIILTNKKSQKSVKMRYIRKSEKICAN